MHVRPRRCGNVVVVRCVAIIGTIIALSLSSFMKLSHGFLHHHSSVTTTLHSFRIVGGGRSSHLRQSSSSSSSTTTTSPFILYATISDNDAKTTNMMNAKKKKKKNKYASFSKVDKLQQDPFEAMVEESKQKLNEIEQNKSNKKSKKEQQQQQAQQKSRPVQQIIYPNINEINPYDPSTFGYVEIGTILGSHGVHGYIKVKGCTDYPQRLTTSGNLLHIKSKNKRAPRPITITNGKQIGSTTDESYLIQIQGIYNRTSADLLKGSTLYYATQQDEILNNSRNNKNDDDNDDAQNANIVQDLNDEFLVSDLVTLNVYLLEEEEDQEQEDHPLVGVVKGIVLAEEMCSIPGIGHDMLEVEIKQSQSQSQQPSQQPQKDLVLIPLVPEIVPKIDFSKQEIYITPPSGLLDLTYIREEKVKIKGLLPPAKEDVEIDTDNEDTK